MLKKLQSIEVSHITNTDNDWETPDSLRDTLPAFPVIPLKTIEIRHPDKNPYEDELITEKNYVPRMWTHTLRSHVDTNLWTHRFLRLCSIGILITLAFNIPWYFSLFLALSISVLVFTARSKW